MKILDMSQVKIAGKRFFGSYVKCLVGKHKLMNRESGKAAKLQKMCDEMKELFA